MFLLKTFVTPEGQIYVIIIYYRNSLKDILLDTLNPKGDWCMKIVTHLYEFREHNNLTLRQLSTLSGLSRNYLNKIENGVSLPKIDEAYRLADILHTTITMLFEWV